MKAQYLIGLEDHVPLPLGTSSFSRKMDVNYFVFQTLISRNRMNLRSFFKTTENVLVSKKLFCFLRAESPLAEICFLANS